MLGPFNRGSEQLGVPGPLLIPALLPVSGDSPIGLVSKEALDNSSFHKPPPLTNASQSRWALPPQSQSLPQSRPCGVWREPPSSPPVLPHALSCQPLGAPSQPFLPQATSPAPPSPCPWGPGWSYHDQTFVYPLSAHPWPFLLKRLGSAADDSSGGVSGKPEGTTSEHGKSVLRCLQLLWGTWRGATERDGLECQTRVQILTLLLTS